MASETISESFTTCEQRREKVTKDRKSDHQQRFKAPCVCLPFWRPRPGRHRPGSSADWRRSELWRRPLSSLHKENSTFQRCDALRFRPQNEPSFPTASSGVSVNMLQTRAGSVSARFHVLKTMALMKSPGRRPETRNHSGSVMLQMTPQGGAPRPAPARRLLRVPSPDPPTHRDGS